MSKRHSGFTLIEILIVVIILGILAAIVIPQFTSASEDAKQSNVATTVQSVRGQIELYKLNHGDQYPSLSGTNWLPLTSRSAYGGVTYGPYMQSVPLNPFNQSTSVGTAASGTTDGWAMVTANGVTKFYGLGKGGTWLGD
jgi:general secretion pathway protein G